MAAKKPRAQHLEVCEPLGAVVNNYDGQNVGNTLGYHLTELSTKRRWVPNAAVDTLLQAGTAAVVLSTLCLLRVRSLQTSLSTLTAKYKSCSPATRLHLILLCTGPPIRPKSRRMPGNC